MLTVAQAALRLGVNPRRVRQFIASGRLKATRFGGAWAIDVDDLREFAAIERVRGYHMQKQNTDK